MKRFLAVLLVAVFFLVGCNGTVPVPAEPTRGEPVEPTAVIPTNVPTETAVPSPTPTEVPTATPEPSDWEIARQMVVDTIPLCEQQTQAPINSDLTRYDVELGRAFLEEYPEVNSPGWEFVSNGFVFTEKSGLPSPFSLFDLNPLLWSEMVDSLPAGITPIELLGDPQARILFTCESYGMFLRYTSENFDGDGILAGEAWLFYEVGGTQPNVLDGELVEVHFTFPPAP